MSTPIIIGLDYDRGHKTWVAKIKGTAPKFGLDREFVGSMQGKHKKGKGRAEYLLEDNTLYEVCEKDVRSFILVSDGEARPIERDAMLKWIGEMQAQAKKAAEILDRALEHGIERANGMKFNGEGGFSVN